MATGTQQTTGIWNAVLAMAEGTGTVEEVKMAVLGYSPEIVAEVVEIAGWYAEGLLTTDEAMLKTTDALTRQFYPQ